MGVGRFGGKCVAHHEQSYELRRVAEHRGHRGVPRHVRLGVQVGGYGEADEQAAGGGRRGGALLFEPRGAAIAVVLAVPPPATAGVVLHEDGLTAQLHRGEVSRPPRLPLVLREPFDAAGAVVLSKASAAGRRVVLACGDPTDNRTSRITANCTTSTTQSARRSLAECSRATRKTWRRRTARARRMPSASSAWAGRLSESTVQLNPTPIF